MEYKIRIKEYCEGYDADAIKTIQVALKKINTTLAASAATDISPNEPDNVMNVLRQSPCNKRVVLVGLDVYPDGDSTGLPFEDPHFTKRSNQNIARKICNMYSMDYKQCYGCNLGNIPEVFLINAGFTVLKPSNKIRNTGCHIKIWKEVFITILTQVIEKSPDLQVILIMHKDAFVHNTVSTLKKRYDTKLKTCMILQCPHPCTSVFLSQDHKPFETTNYYLMHNSLKPIKWYKALTTSAKAYEVDYSAIPGLIATFVKISDAQESFPIDVNDFKALLGDHYSDAIVRHSELTSLKKYIKTESEGTPQASDYKEMVFNHWFEPVSTLDEFDTPIVPRTKVSNMVVFLNNTIYYWIYGHGVYRILPLDMHMPKLYQLGTFTESSKYVISSHEILMELITTSSLNYTHAELLLELKIRYCSLEVDAVSDENANVEMTTLHNLFYHVLPHTFYSMAKYSHCATVTGYTYRSYTMPDVAVPDNHVILNLSYNNYTLKIRYLAYMDGMYFAVRNTIKRCHPERLQPDPRFVVALLRTKNYLQAYSTYETVDMGIYVDSLFDEVVARFAYYSPKEIDDVFSTITLCDTTTPPVFVTKSKFHLDPQADPDKDLVCQAYSVINMINSIIANDPSILF